MRTGRTPTALRGLLLLVVIVVLVASPLVAEWFATSSAAENLLARAEVTTTGTAGNVASILRGPLPPEAGRVVPGLEVRVTPGEGNITFEFREPTRIAALLLQAPPDDAYRVDAVLAPGGERMPVWSVETAWQGGRARPQAHRLTRFEPPLEVTALSFSNVAAYGTQSSVAALRAFAEVPEGWPDTQALESPARRARYPLTVDVNKINLARFALACMATTLLALCSPLVLRRLSARTAGVLRAGAIAASLCAGLGWWNGMQLTPEGNNLQFESYWDVYHYYMAGKYAPEVGHHLLYDCYLTAEVEDGLTAHQVRRPAVRDLTTRTVRPTGEALASAPSRCRPHFTPERWSAWKHDHQFFRTRMRSHYWNWLPMDHGFNATPAWLILGRGLTSIAPLDDAVFTALISLDTILFVSMFAMVWTAFGWRIACAAIVFFGTNQLAGSYEMLGAYLRTDWLCLSVIGICLLKMDRPFLAGAALAYATLLRIFPGLLVVGLLLKIARDAMEARSLRLPTRHRNLIAGGLLATLLIGSLSLVAGGRLSAWPEFVDNITEHANLELEVVGLPALLRYAGREGLHEEEPAVPGWLVEKATFNDIGWQLSDSTWQLLRAAPVLLFVALFFAAIRNEHEWVVAVLAVGFIPFAGDLAHYYYVILLAWAFLAARSVAASWGFAALTLIFALFGLSFLIGMGVRDNSRLYAWGSAIVIVYAFCVTARIGWTGRGRTAAGARSGGPGEPQLDLGDA